MKVVINISENKVWPAKGLATSVAWRVGVLLKSFGFTVVSEDADVAGLVEHTPIDVDPGHLRASGVTTISIEE